MPRMLVVACVVLLAAAVTATEAGVNSDGRGRATNASRQACQVVPGERLEAFYPVMPGWVRGEPTTEPIPRSRCPGPRSISTVV